MTVWNYFNLSAGYFVPITVSSQIGRPPGMLEMGATDRAPLAPPIGVTPPPALGIGGARTMGPGQWDYHFNMTGYLNDSNLTATEDNLRPLGLPMQSQIILIVLYTMTTILAVVGNVIVIVVFSYGRRSKSDLRPFLINLAICDLTMSLFCLPFTFTPTMFGHWVFSAPMCPVVLYMQTMSVTASVSTNMAIGIDRYWVVTFPLKSRITKSRSKIVIAVIWLIAVGLSSVQLFVGRASEIPYGNQTILHCDEIWPDHTYRRFYTFFLLILTYGLPLTILSITYGFVGRKLWQRTTPGNADQVRDSHQLKSKRKVIKMLVVVVALFGICWLPLHVFFLVLDFNHDLPGEGQESLFNAIYYSVHWLAMANSFTNPIIYGFMNDSFRADLQVLWRRWFPCCKCCACVRHPNLTRITSHSMRFSKPESQYHKHNPCGNNSSDSGGSASGKMHDSTRKLVNIKVNGVGRFETELDVKDKLLPHQNNHTIHNNTENSFV